MSPFGSIYIIKYMFLALFFKKKSMVAILEVQKKIMWVQVDRIINDKAMLIM
jgi:hypothetical protein